MAHLKTNIQRKDARDRIKNLENITLMSNINNNLSSTNSYKSNIVEFKNNKLTSSVNHKTLLKVTKGFFDLEECCSTSKSRAVNLNDGLYSKIRVNNQNVLADSSCNRPPLYHKEPCNDKTENLPNTIKERNFSYPIPISKNSCCDMQINQPSLNLNSSENHTKYLPIMSKVKSYKYRTTDTSDPVTYPNFEIVNENNLVGFFDNNIYTTTNCCAPSQTTSSTRVGNQLKYTVRDAKTNCSCVDNNDYTINTSLTTSSVNLVTSSSSSFFSRKWSPFHS